MSYIIKKGLHAIACLDYCGVILIIIKFEIKFSLFLLK
jgi:hypothetical protein